MNSELYTFFKDLGFSENETRVYLALLDLGQTTIGPISAKSHVQPTKAYIAIERLIDRGLLSFVHISNAKYFQTNDPEQVMRIVHQQEQKAKDILPLLRQKQKSSAQHQEAEVYDGKEALHALYNSIIDSIGPDDFYYSFALKKEYFQSDSAKLFFRQKHQLMIQKGLQDDRMIVHEDVKEDFNKTFGDITGLRVCYVKVDLPLGLTVTKDRVINTVWQDRPLAVEIRSLSLVEQYKKFFLQVWDENCTI